ncbi:MAG: SPOR domain-containing protein [Bacteroidaceae bacterium]|nr:SPOR domain-containing protein [Bacteroidaceae bacterium]
MKELARHIASLLLENDCVIIPDFGGFITHSVPSQHVEDEHLFLPPMRVIGFNPQLRINDGLLAQSLMSVYGTTFPDAVKMLQQQSKELTAILHDKGKMELENVGELRYNIRGQYEFTPFDNLIATPSIYGLDAFKIQDLKELQKVNEASLEKETPAEVVVYEGVNKQEKETQTHENVLKPAVVSSSSVSAGKESGKVIDFNRYMRHAASVAAVIIFVVASFFVASPILNTDIKSNEASMLPTEMLKQSLAMSSVVTHQPVQRSTKATPAVVQSDATVSLENEKETTEAISADAELPTETPAKVSEASVSKDSEVKLASTKKLYNVIIASVGSAEAAEKAVKDLQKRGFTHAKAIIGESKARVSVVSFEVEADAYRAIQRFQSEGLFEEAWVLRR